MLISAGFALSGRVRSCSLELDWTKLGLLSVAQWVELSRITISGAMTRKEDFISPSRSYEANGVKRSVTRPADSLPIRCLWTHCIFPFHFTPSYISFWSGFHFFFFPGWNLIIQQFSRATICDPAEGAWAIPTPRGRNCDLSSHARSWL